MFTVTTINHTGEDNYHSYHTLGNENYHTYGNNNSTLQL